MVYFSSMFIFKKAKSNRPIKINSKLEGLAWEPFSIKEHKKYRVVESQGGGLSNFETIDPQGTTTS